MRKDIAVEPTLEVRIAAAKRDVEILVERADTVREWEIGSFSLQARQLEKGPFFTVIVDEARGNQLVDLGKSQPQVVADEGRRALFAHFVYSVHSASQVLSRSDMVPLSGYELRPYSQKEDKIARDICSPYQISFFCLTNDQIKYQLIVSGRNLPRFLYTFSGPLFPGGGYQEKVRVDHHAYYFSGGFATYQPGAGGIFCLGNAEDFPSKVKRKIPRQELVGLLDPRKLDPRNIFKEGL